MKQIPLFLALVMLLLVSCTKDDTLTNGGRETIKARFSLSVAEPSVEGASIRSTDTLTVDDSGIENLWALQFENGNFLKKVYLTSINLSNFELDLLSNSTGQSSNIYFVANVGASAFATAPASEAAFKVQTSAIANEAACLFTGASKKIMPMSGCRKNTPIASGVYASSCVLYRMLARIDYTYSVDPSLSFTLKKVRLSGVPLVMQYDSIATAKYPADGASTQSFTYEVAENATTAAPKTLTFYVPDNRRGEGTNTAKTNDKLKLGVTGATAIELLGYTTGTNGGDEITYTLYPGADAYNDYNICRNTIYKLKTNIIGFSPLADARFKKTEMSNCYIVAPSTSVSIPVKRANGSDLGFQLPDVRKDWTVSVYWQTAAGLVTVSADASDMALGRFTVTAGATSGNAVVAVKNASGEIVWSWHIWVTDYNPATEKETNNGFVWMSRNLGATAVANGTATTFATCGGLMYQWGRKDPFPGSSGASTGTAPALSVYNAAGTLMTNTSTTWPGVGTPTATGTSGDAVKYATLGVTPTTQIPFTSQLAYSVKYPLLYLVNWAGSTAAATAAATAVGGQSSWGGLSDEIKSVYDPCPVGWRVPSFYKTATLTSPWSTWVTTQTLTTSAFAALRWDAASVFGTYYYPAAGYRSATTGALTSVGAYGYYWGASPTTTNGYSIIFYTNNVTPSAATTTRTSSCGVRCVQEW